MASIILATLSACSPEQSDQEKLEALRQKRSSIEKEISDLEAKIGSLDTAGPVRFAVKTMVLAPSVFTKNIDIQGLVESDKNVTMSSEYGGKVLEIPVREGQKVAKGTVLVKLDNEILLKNLQEVRNRLELAEITYEKQKRLREKNVGTEMEYLRAKNDFEAMKKQEETLMAQAAKYNLRAPFDGTVDHVFVNAGEMASPGLPVVRIVENSIVKIKADVSESYLSILKPGQKVILKFPALNKEIEAPISSVGQVIDPSNRTFPVFIYLDNKSNLLKPNLLAVVKANEYKNDSAIVVPAKVIRKLSGKSFIFKAEEVNGILTAKRAEVQTGVNSGGNVEIISGLEIGDRVIVEGFQGIDDGAAIKDVK